MSKIKYAIIAAIIGVIAIALVAYLVPSQTTVTMIPITEEEQEKNDALGVAQRYIVTSPTFAFDGDINTLDTEYVGILESSPIQYLIKMAFDSAHGGFGNREGQVLTQVITPHKMEIIVSEGVVISAVTDQTWDELNHQYVLKNPEPKLQSSDEPIVPFEGMATDYSSLVDAIKSRGVLVEDVEEIPAESSSFSIPTRVISVGGADIQVFEFANQPDAEAASLTVSKDGTEIGTSIIRWIDMPHFYTNGRIIVLYVGQNPEITSLLESFLGKQFAGMDNLQSTVDQTEEDAINLIKKQYPQFQDFPSNDLPPKVILTEKSSDGWYVIFETQGSGLPIIEAQCFFVTDTTVTQIGHYKSKGDMKTDVSFKTCS